MEKLKENSDTHHITTRPSVQRISSQTDLDNLVMVINTFNYKQNIFR